MSLPKVFFVQKMLKIYVYSFILHTKFSLSTVFSVHLILLNSFLASSVNVFFRITSLIVNFWVLGFKNFKASNCFFRCSSFVFICFSNALMSGEYLNLACSIILL